MKTEPTEADATTSIAPTTYARQPFQLLQNLQHCQIFVKSKMALSSSALKSISNRPKKVESVVCQPKETNSLASRPRASSISSRQKNAVNIRSTPKTNGATQRRSMQLDSKTKNSDSANDNTNPVGSLTSSPKWSHIKNKFENGSLNAKKLEKTTKDEEIVVKKQTISKNYNSLVPEVHLGACKAKVCGRTEFKKVNDSSVTKPTSTPRVVSPKASNDKRKTENTTIKNLNCKDKSKPRCSSPKNSYSHTANVSHLHSSATKTSRFNSSTNKLSSLHASSLSKTSHSRTSLTNSSVSLSSNSSKNSEFDTISVKKCSVSSVSSELSDIDIPSTETLNAKSTSISKSSCTSTSSSDLAINSKSNESGLNSMSTNSHPSTISNASYKPNLYRVKQKHEDKPILTFNRIDQCDGAKSIKSKVVRNSIISKDKETPLSNIFNKDKIVTNSNPSNKQNSYPSKNNTSVVDDQVDKIKEVVKNSQSSSKTVWIKNEAGNWTKKGNTENTVGYGNTISQSKVASLRSKFLEPTKETSTPLTKSVTTPSVPSKTEFSRPLAKSSTTSSICDKFILKDIISEKSQAINTNAPNSQNTANATPAVARNSLDGDKSLNIVQRAILSFEGSLALLSPESQRRLKLVNEKVQAQTDDVKILKARKSELTKTNISTKSVQKEKSPSTSKTDVSKVVGEPLLPTRSFLTRYQLTKQATKNQKNGFRSYTKDDEPLKNSKPNLSLNSATKAPKKFSLEKPRNADKGKETKEQNKPNSLPTTSNSSPTSLKQNSADSSPKSNTENEYTLQPNPSFLWCRSRTASSDLSKSSTTSTVSLTSSDYRNYYDVQNYYSTLDLEIDKTSDISEEPIYIDSQDSNSSDYYTTSGRLPYQNIPPTAQSKMSEYPFTI